MIEEAPRESIVLYNKTTKQSTTVHVDMGFCNDADDILVRIGGDEYKLVSTKTPEQIRLEKNIVTFGTQEFPRIAKKFPEFGSSSQHMKFTENIRACLQEHLQRSHYKTIRIAIEKDPQVFTRICHAFAQYISATRTVDAILEEAKSRRLDEVYMLDYLKRYLKIMNLLVDRDHPPLRQTISDMFAEINKDIDIDDRRPIGSSKVLELLSPFMGALQRYKDQMNQVPMEEHFYETGNEDEDRSAMWEAVYQASCSAKTNLEDYQVVCEQRTQAFAEMKEDKLHYHTKRIVDLHKNLLRQYQESFASSQKNPDNLMQAQETFVSALKRYTADIAGWGCEFACDRRPLHSFYTKMLELQYDTVFFYLEQRTKDEQWILHLVEAISKHIPYLERALSGELKVPGEEPSTKD